MLMQDPDTFLIKPYRCWDGERLNYMALENTTHGSYDGMIESIFGFPRQTYHCFITEFVPVLKRNHTAMREFLEHRHNCNWLDALIENTTKMPTIPPWGNGEIIRWFSEYEVIGNWAMHCSPVDFTFQQRFEYDSLDKLVNLSQQYNAVADAVPDLSRSLQWNADKFEVTNFDHWHNLIKQKLA